jgi:ATP-dependent helicase HrpB
LDESWPVIDEALASHRNLVLVAEPGAGKTTRFPPRLIRSRHFSGQRVLMLEPRRLAARASAHRIAEEQGWRLGEEVGYQVRFENRSSPHSKLIVLTEGLLTRRLERDPDLKDVECVILDEFHERSLHTDLALGLLFEIQELSRPDLRIVVMSATLDAERVAAFLGRCPIVRVPGRTYPVDVTYASHPLSLETGPATLDRIGAAVNDTISGARARIGDVLVFLPGAREIRGVRERIAGTAGAKGFVCVELHGSLALDEQNRAIKKLAEPKIILATNIAETSLTVDGVGTVIDSGLARVSRIDALGFPRLELSRISKASATQRAGRAGRQFPGVCHRLWSRLDDASMPEFELPEILRSDLSEAMLALASQGVSDPAAFSWFEKPKEDSLALARELLFDLGFVDNHGMLTLPGREAAKLPTPVRIARLLIEAARENQVTLGAELGALLTEKDILLNVREARSASHAESDVLLRYHLLHASGRGGRAAGFVDPFAARNVHRVAELLEAATRRLTLSHIGEIPNVSQRPGWSKNLLPDEIASRLLLVAFPDRLCRRRRPKSPAARMVGGRGFDLAPLTTVETSELFLALDAGPAPRALRDLQVTMASRVERSWIEFHFQNRIARQKQVIFDAETETVQKQTALAFHDLPIEAPQIARPSDDESFPVLTQACRERWPVLFRGRDDLKRLYERWAFIEKTANSAQKAKPWPELDSFRDEVINEICFAETRLDSVLAKPIADVLLRHLPRELAALLDEAAPESLVVPSGSRIRIHYPPEREPYLEVRIQEIFGLKSSPKIASGRVPVVLHLLGPNFRPVQVTADLESFWQAGYAEVRKELRARYPKHSWPENPLDAKPEAKGARRQR